MEKYQDEIRTEGIGVKNVPTLELKPNPHNPRMLFDRKPLDILRDSIKHVGILVPLTIYRERKTGHMFILDGQRRWICAQELKLETVPVNEVAEPSLAQNIVTMFQIHKLRQDWELMPTALKLEVLMRELKENNVARLVELTTLDEAVVTRCKKLLYYPKHYQDMMLDADPGKRVKADFFIELYSVITDRDLKRMSWFRRDRFIDQMLEKYLIAPKIIKSVTDFRLIKQHMSNARKAGKLNQLSSRLRRFADDRDVPIDSLELREAQIHATASKLVREVTRIKAAINQIDIESYYGEEELWKALTELMGLLRQKLVQADKRVK